MPLGAQELLRSLWVRELDRRRHDPVRTAVLHARCEWIDGHSFDGHSFDDTTVGGASPVRPKATQRVGPTPSGAGRRLASSDRLCEKAPAQRRGCG
jgi:hypothetical protein